MLTFIGLLFILFGMWILYVVDQFGPGFLSHFFNIPIKIPFVWSLISFFFIFVGLFLVLAEGL